MNERVCFGSEKRVSERDKGNCLGDHFRQKLEMFRKAVKCFGRRLGVFQKAVEWFRRRLGIRKEIRRLLWKEISIPDGD